jgi:heptosyltransferase I
LKLPLSQAPKKILVLRLGALGDLIFLLPALTLLRQRWPEAEIHWVVKRSYASLIENHPLVNRIWPFHGGVTQIFKTGLELRKERFDLVLDYHANLRSGILSWISGAPTRVGFARPFNKEGNSIFNHHRVSPPNLRTHKIDRNLFLTNALFGEPLDLDCQPSFPVNPAAIQSFDALREGRTRPIVVIHPGTSPKGEIKRWFEDRYAKVISHVLDEKEVEILLLWGSKGEFELAKKIRELSGKNANIWIPEHRFSFPEILALYKRSIAYLGVDSGPMHLANAAGLPVITLYGPKSLDIYRPYFPGASILAKNDEVDCPPCNATLCQNPKGRVCLEALKVEEVAQTLINIVERNI